MNDFPTIILRRGKEIAVKRRHPWVFSGAIFKMPDTIADGDIVEVVDSKNQFMAYGHYQRSSIAVRLFTFKQQAIDDAFWNNKIQAAFTARQFIQLDAKNTNAFRLVHAEGDGLPGLIVDIYGSTAVVQCHSIGMHLVKNILATAIINASDGRITSVYDKSKESLPFDYATQMENGFLLDAKADAHAIISENGHNFFVNWAEGQKTGFFLDQRDNRQLLGQYAKGKTVLNTFCYSGGFSVYALQQGASHVLSIDASKKAIDWTEKNMELVKDATGTHESLAADVLKYFREPSDSFDIVVVDPPAFAKSMKKRHNAVQGYKRLNAAALKHVKKGGLLFTFSCSQVVDRQLFYNTIVAAAIEAGRNIKVVHFLSQPADHPISIFHPEGSYLKGLVLYVE